jgi:Ca-activated chloride channel family protein
MNDPRITAYALGELESPAREAFERELAQSEELQRELQNIIDFSNKLSALPSPEDALTDTQRDQLRSEIAMNLKVAQQPHFNFRPYIVIGSAAAAAGLTLALLYPAVNGSKMAAQKAPEARQINIAAAPAATPLPSLVDIVKDSSAPTSDLALLEKTIANQMQGDATAQPEQLNLAADDGKPAGSANSNATVALGGKDAEAKKFDEVAALSTETPSSAKVPVEFSKSVAGQDLAKSQPMPASPVIAGNRAQLQTRLAEKAELPAQSLLRSEFDTEAYASIQENVFLDSKENPLSTFSIDVDTASYSNVRRFLQDEQVPPAGAIRTEELINYFSYDYPQPKGDAPFSVNLEVATAPWDSKRELVRIGLKGLELPASERGSANLVFLVDVSGSMNEPNKLPLLKRSLQALVENLSPKDRVAIATYAGSSGLVLPSTPGTEKQKILDALENLDAGGSTNGASGIRLAYETARENFLKEGNNRVILCTDGDFNVGVTDQSELVRLIEKERASGVFLSVLGFGTGNLKDSTMEMLADKGNGNYGYVDSFAEGRKLLVDQMGATLFTIAKDVKIQVEFNPAKVAGYRLIGYENRLLAKEDFNDDKKDAGEIGAGHTVTALYEIVRAGQPLPDRPSVDPLKYQSVPEITTRIVTPSDSSELLTVKLRYKAPDGDTSKLLSFPLTAPAEPLAFDKASTDFQFASAVAAFGMKLRGSPMAGDISWNDIQKIVRRNLGEDPGSYRAEFLTLVEKASRLKADGKSPE